MSPLQKIPVDKDQPMLTVKGANNIFSFSWAEAAADWILSGIGYKGKPKSDN